MRERQRQYTEIQQTYKTVEQWKMFLISHFPNIHEAMGLYDLWNDYNKSSCMISSVTLMTYTQIWISSKRMQMTVHASYRLHVSDKCMYPYYRIQTCVCTCMLYTHSYTSRMCLYSTDCMHVSMCTRMVVFVL